MTEVGTQSPTSVGNGCVARVHRFVADLDVDTCGAIAKTYAGQCDDEEKRDAPLREKPLHRKMAGRRICAVPGNPPSTRRRWIDLEKYIGIDVIVKAHDHCLADFETGGA